MYTKESGTIQCLGNAKALAAHRGRESTYQKISERFFWHGMIEDIKEYIKTCKSCQQQGKIFKKISPELKSIPVPNEVMKQIGIDLCTLSEVDEFKHLLVCIDYFSKWFEAKAVKDKSAPTVAKFLYEIICRHGCMRIQINDQGKNLPEMTGTEQRNTSAYHPQSNIAYASAKIVLSKIRTIKSSGGKAERMAQYH